MYIARNLFMKGASNHGYTILGMTTKYIYSGNGRLMFDVNTSILQYIDCIFQYIPLKYWWSMTLQYYTIIINMLMVS